MVAAFALEPVMTKLTHRQWLDAQEQEVAARIADLRLACETWRWTQFPKYGAPPRPNKALGSHLLEPTPEWWMTYGKYMAKKNRPQPTRAGLDALDRWLHLLSFKLERQDRGIVLFHLGWNASWRKVAKMLGGTISHEHARNRYARAIDVLVRERRKEE